MKRRISMLLAVTGVIALAGCDHLDHTTPPDHTTRADATAVVLPLSLQGLTLDLPVSNPLTVEKARLGEQLFLDTRLSVTGQMACVTCHLPDKGWTDGLRLSPKHDGSMNTRNSPTMYGAGFYPELYWDGRAQGLETQILAAWKGNMGADPDAIAIALNAIDGYASQFDASFGGAATGERIVQALASFVRTVHAGDTPWDRQPQDEAALETTTIGRGFKVFTETAECSLCHAPPLFSDMDFHNIGVGYDTETPDLGRGKALAGRAKKAGEAAPPEAETLQGAFKTPSLRGVALTGPYLHDGSLDTLEETVDFMLAGGTPNTHLDKKMKPHTLTPEQRDDLLAFLRALTPDTTYEAPPLP